MAGREGLEPSSHRLTAGCSRLSELHPHEWRKRRGIEPADLLTGDLSFSRRVPYHSATLPLVVVWVGLKPTYSSFVARCCFSSATRPWSSCEGSNLDPVLRRDSLCALSYRMLSLEERRRFELPKPGGTGPARFRGGCVNHSAHLSRWLPRTDLNGQPSGYRPLALPVGATRQ